MSSEEKIIAVQPVGPVSENVLHVVAETLQSIYRIQSHVLPDRPMPENALDPRRGQYNCYRILEFLNEGRPQHAVKILGVTDVDLFIPILTYVFGEAELGGGAAIISTHRLERNADGESLPPKQVGDRIAKIAVHELAHTFRLSHCKEGGCLMASFPALRNIDEMPFRFCRYCLTFLRDAYEEEGIVWTGGVGVVEEESRQGVLE